MGNNKKALLIINPISGTRSKTGLEDYLRRRLAEKGLDLESRFTRGSGDAYSMAADAVKAGYVAVITAGGDGTVNEAASALCGSDTKLGIIPLGSGNGLARSLNIPQDVKYATDVICDGYFDSCDHGVVNGRNFFCTFGIGFDAAVSEKFAREKRRGRTSYLKNVFIEFLKYSPGNYTISIGDKVITEKALLVAVCNASQYGNNAYIAPHAKLTDGLLDVIVFHTGSPLAQMLAGVELLTGRLDRNTLVDTFRVPSVVISRKEDGPAHIDGDPVNLGKEMRIECSPGSLKIYVPKEDVEFKPIITPLKSVISDIHYDLRALLGIK